MHQMKAPDMPSANYMRATQSSRSRSTAPNTTKVSRQASLDGWNISGKVILKERSQRRSTTMAVGLVTKCKNSVARQFMRRDDKENSKRLLEGPAAATEKVLASRRNIKAQKKAAEKEIKLGVQR